jgi:hypothetical protein
MLVVSTLKVTLEIAHNSKKIRTKELFEDVKKLDEYR